MAELETKPAHAFAGTCSGQDRYWSECRCGWTSKRQLSTEQAYADWQTHAASSIR